ncbi:hypothetical protein [Bartonella vinsonii]|uniref:hypothetical protein n=1 Tax=Bartonella vinsonii TaxID=33047 RepID=UPI0003111A3D|nr:hypothetical protein [Bartonella vinsonii]
MEHLPCRTNVLKERLENVLEESRRGTTGGGEMIACFLGDVVERVWFFLSWNGKIFSFL